MDLSIFKPNVPLTISGELDKSIKEYSDTADEDKIIGAVDRTREKNDYYLAGMNIDYLNELGITEPNQLGQLMSMSNRNKGPVRVIRFQKQNDRIAFYLTDGLVNTLKNNKDLNPLTSSNWIIYKIVEPNSSSPYNGELEDTGERVHFPNIKKFFRDVIENGLQSKGDVRLSKDQIRTTNLDDFGLGLISDESEYVDLEVKPEKSQHDSIKEMVEQSRQLLNKDNHSQGDKDAVEAVQEETSSALANAVYQPAFDGQSSEFMLEEDDFSEMIDDMMADKSLDPDNQDITQDFDIDPDNLTPEDLEFKHSSDILEDHFKKLPKVSLSEQVYFELKDDYSKYLDQIRVTRKNFRQLDDVGKAKMVKLVEDYRSRLLTLLINSLKRNMVQAKRATDLDNPNVLPSVVSQRKELYEIPLNEFMEESTDEYNESIENFEREEDELFEEWYRQVQEDPRGMFNEMRQEVYDRSINEMAQSARDNLTLRTSELNEEYNDWLVSFYKQRLDGDLENINSELEGHTSMLHESLTSRLESEIYKSRERIAEKEREKEAELLAEKQAPLKQEAHEDEEDDLILPKGGLFG